MYSYIGSEVNMHQLQVSFPIARSSPGQRTEPRQAEKPKRKISEARRAYLRRYYEANKEKAREYQRRYNLMHKKKARLAESCAGTNSIRQAVRETYHASDIMQAPTEKSMKILQLILKGERHFTI